MQLCAVDITCKTERGVNILKKVIYAAIAIFAVLIIVCVFSFLSEPSLTVTDKTLTPLNEIANLDDIAVNSISGMFNVSDKGLLYNENILKFRIETYSYKSKSD